MVVPERIAKLRGEYTDKYVVVDGGCPELARFKDVLGRVKTVNCNGRALVQFDVDNDRGWHDIELDYLKVIDNPERKLAAANGKQAAPAAAAQSAGPPARKESKQKLSKLEVARKERQAEQAAETPPEGGS
jgi:hypothetical protein